MENLKSIILEQDFFKPLSGDHLDLIVGCASNRRLKKGEYLFKEETDANEFYLIRAGKISLECHQPRREPFVFEALTEGDVLGWSWLLPPYKWHFDARTNSEVRLLAFNAKCLRQKMETDPVLGYSLMKLFFPVIVQRMQTARLRMMDVYSGGVTSSFKEL